MTLIERIKANRNDGIPGPWHWVDAESDAPASFLPDRYERLSLRTTWQVGEGWQKLPKFILDAEAGTANEHPMDLLRIASVPEMEAALLAAEELAAVIDSPDQSDGKAGRYHYDWGRIDDAIAAYREATK